MVGKILALVFAFVILAAISSTAIAEECGDGKCEAGEDCSTCATDCGSCNGAFCIVDDSCSTNICCNGVCRDSCIVYSTTKDQGVTGLFLTSPISLVLFEIALIVAVLAVIFILWRKKHRSASHAPVDAE